MVVKDTIGGSEEHDGVCSDYRRSGIFLITRRQLPDHYCLLSYRKDERDKKPTRMFVRTLNCGAAKKKKPAETKRSLQLPAAIHF